MKEKLKKMTVAELQARQKELKAIGENPETRSAEELEQLAEERTAIDEELAERRAAAALEQLRRDTVAGTVGVNVLARQPETEQRSLGADSPEYRSAWLKKMAVRNGVALFGELTEAESRAYTHTTANTGAVVPTEVMNRIAELVESEYGFHIIFCPPMSADHVLEYDSSGEPYSPRAMASAALFDNMMDGWFEEAEYGVKYVDGFEDLDLNELFGVGK